jgi:hypothetical protein
MGCRATQKPPRRARPTVRGRLHGLSLIPVCTASSGSCLEDSLEAKALRPAGPSQPLQESPSLPAHAFDRVVKVCLVGSRHCPRCRLELVDDRGWIECVHGVFLSSFRQSTELTLTASRIAYVRPRRKVGRRLIACGNPHTERVGKPPPANGQPVLSAPASARSVFGPRIPSAVRPPARWKRLTASVVDGPYCPSILPGE